MITIFSPKSHAFPWTRSLIYKPSKSSAWDYPLAKGELGRIGKSWEHGWDAQHPYAWRCPQELWAVLTQHPIDWSILKGTAAGFPRGTRALLAAPLGRFPLDVEGPFNIIFFLFEHSRTFCPFGLLINVAVCFPFSQCVLPTNLIFPSDVESCRRTWKALSSHALPQTTPFPWGIPRLSTWDCDLGKPSSVMSEYLQCFSLFGT